MIRRGSQRVAKHTPCHSVSSVSCTISRCVVILANHTYSRYDSHVLHVLHGLRRTAACTCCYCSCSCMHAAAAARACLHACMHAAAYACSATMRGRRERPLPHGRPPRSITRYVLNDRLPCDTSLLYSTSFVRYIMYIYSTSSVRHFMYIFALARTSGAGPGPSPKRRTSFGLHRNPTSFGLHRGPKLQWSPKLDVSEPAT